MVEKSLGMYGLLAKFDSPESLIKAVRRVYDSGYRRFDAYAPYPVEELSKAMRLKGSPLPYVILAGGLFGGMGGFFMQVYATMIDWPLNIGGRSFFSWPAYVPITFEMTILFAAVFGVLGLFVMTRFPQPYHPVFNSEDFNAHASQDGFYLDIEARDPHFNLEETRSFLKDLGAVEVSEVEA
jgi:hypothetical protein